MDINTINARFQQLIQKINDNSIVLTHLDLLRIQLVYEPNAEPDIVEFTAQYWSKLSVYNGVYCNLGPSNHFTFNKELINNGDFLIKLPDNKSLRIPGSSPYYYKPVKYETETTELTFQLMTDGTQSESSIPIQVPQWEKGSNTGHIWHCKFNANGDLDGSLPDPAPTLNDFQYYTRYFIDREEIIFPPTIIEWLNNKPNINIQLSSQSSRIDAYVIYHAGEGE